MFITSFGEQNITYKCCSNFLIHLYGECITKQEWSTYLETDPTITVDIQNSEEDFLVSIDEQEFSLWYDRNSCDLLTKNPTPEAIGKMIDISKKLKATVQGEESEIYLTPNDVIKR